MVNDESFGIIPLQNIGGIWQVLLIKQRYGRHWSFPKGHPEGIESPRESACREFFEETGLNIKRFIAEESMSESYQFRSHSKTISKTVHYFIAEVTGQITLDPLEIMACKWVPLAEARDHVTFPQAKVLCEKALKLITDCQPS